MVVSRVSRLARAGMRWVSYDTLRLRLPSSCGYQSSMQQAASRLIYAGIGRCADFHLWLDFSFITHGDSRIGSRGGTGFGGAVYTAARGFKRVATGLFGLRRAQLIT